MAQKSGERWPGRSDSCLDEAVPKCKRDPVAARTVHRALLNRNNAMRCLLVVPHDEPAAARS